MSLPDRFCPACFRSVAVAAPAVVPARAGTGVALAERWVYRPHDRTTWRGEEPSTGACPGSGRTEHEARQAW